MITELTKEQVARFPEFVDKWLKIGLSTERVNLQRAQQISDCYYKELAGKPPAPVILMSNPLFAEIAALMLSDNQVRNQVGNQVRNQVGNQVRNQVGNQVWNQVGNQVRNQVGNQVWNQVENQVWNQVRNQVENQVENQVWNQVGHFFVLPYIEGHLSASYFSFYNFIEDVLGLQFDKKWEWYKSTSEIGWFFPLDNICIISDRPSKIQMRNGRLHCGMGMALEYTDGWGIYALNGVKMKPEYVLTPASEMTPEMVLAEQNVDQRRELIRKIGVEKLKSGGKQIEKVGEYELIDMSPIITGRYAPYLWMKNPSVDNTFHLEGVATECRTIEQAINWRAGNILQSWKPEQLN